MAGKIGILDLAEKKGQKNNYCRAVEAAGGEYEMLPATLDSDEIQRQADRCSAFIFIGGPDIHPARYGKGPHPKVTSCLTEENEEYCFQIAKAIVFDRKKPCLGVCLGCQLINVIFGGTLYEDVYTQIPGAYWHRHYEKYPDVENMHRVTFPEGSPLRDLFGTDWLCANSSHHQAVRDLGKGLSVGALSDDGVVEAVYGPDFDKHFVLGLQWHPERIFDKVYGHQFVFEKLVSLC